MPIDCDGALKDPASDGSRDPLGLDVSAASTAIDLPQKRPVIESAHRAALWSRSPAWCWSSSVPTCRHVEQSRVVQYGPVQGFSQTLTQRAANRSLNLLIA
jgi:hypothetical protein